eukprot:5794364-Pleurochrysis_carterae.AAC.1
MYHPAQLSFGFATGMQIPKIFTQRFYMNLCLQLFIDAEQAGIESSRFRHYGLRAVPNCLWGSEYATLCRRVAAPPLVYSNFTVIVDEISVQRVVITYKCPPHIRGASARRGSKPWIRWHGITMDQSRAQSRVKKARVTNKNKIQTRRSQKLP